MSILFINRVKKKISSDYSVKLIFDDYRTEDSLKANSRAKRAEKASHQKVISYMVNDNTPVKDFHSFLSNTVTKDHLTAYLRRN